MEAVLIESATKYEVIKLLIFSTGIESLAPTAGTNGFNPGPEESSLLSSSRLIKSAKKVNGCSVEALSLSRSPPMFDRQNAAIDLYMSFKVAFGPFEKRKALGTTLSLSCIPPILIFKSPG